ncbi:MAG: hypothetical protein WC003_17285 [Terrimicrobiaceae bacterium]
MNLEWKRPAISAQDGGGVLGDAGGGADAGEAVDHVFDEGEESVVLLGYGIAGHKRIKVSVVGFLWVLRCRME